MIEIILQNFAGDVALMPIRGVQFISSIDAGSPYDANIIIHNLEAESSFRISPITRNTHLGSIKRLAYKFEANLYIPYNKFNENNLINIFEELLKGKYSMSLILGTARGVTENGYTPPRAINSSYGTLLTIANDTLNHSIEIESIEYRQRIILRVFGFVKKLSEIAF